MHEPGMRVGAIFDGNPETKIVRFLGYGEYVGDEVPDEDARGLASLARAMERPNPKIQLDNGDVVWGGECWWGPENRMREQIGHYKAQGFSIQDIRIEDMRRKQDG